MNAFILMLATIGAAVWSAWAFRMDRADRREWSDIREWHLLHEHTAGCIECQEGAN